MIRGLVLLGCLLAVTLIALATITPLCGQLFACGCTYAQGMAFCNVGDPGSADCPWCSHGTSGFYVPFSAILAIAAIATVDSLQRSRWRWWVGILGGLIGYLGAAVVVGLATALYRGYPFFLWWRL